MVKCVFCGTHKPVERTGVRRLQKDKPFDRPYDFTFDHIDLENSAFISVREPAGRASGFPEVGRITLREAVDEGIAKDLRDSLKRQCLRVLEILGGKDENSIGKGK